MSGCSNAFSNICRIETLDTRQFSIRFSAKVIISVAMTSAEELWAISLDPMMNTTILGRKDESAVIIFLFLNTLEILRPPLQQIVQSVYLLKIYNYEKLGL